MSESGIGCQTYWTGIELFNDSRFFDAHEVLEDVWRETSGPEKSFLQGLVQLAVALHHHSTGNSLGAGSLLTKAHRNLWIPARVRRDSSGCAASGGLCL